MARRKKFRSSSGMEQITNVVDLLNDGLNDPEFEKYIALVVARIAVKKIKRYIREGGKPTEPLSDVTKELTKNLRNRVRGNARPLNDSRKLINSIKVISFTVSKGNFKVDVGIDDASVVEYAYLQEYGGQPNGAVKGSKNGERTLAGYVPDRPFLRPGLRDAMDEAISGKVTRILNRAIKAMVNGENWRKVFMEAKV
jgi:hypothetical protein